MNGIFYFIFTLFIVSRFLFISNYSHFYDIPEYFRESINDNFSQSLSNSHEVIHPLWLGLLQIFQKITPSNNVWEISLISVIFGLFSFIFFYFLIKKLFSKKIAILSLIPLTLFPHLWLIQTNALHESLDSFLLILTFYFFVLFLEKKKIIPFIFTLIFLSLAIFDFFGILIWTPVLIGLVILKNKKKILTNSIWAVSIIVISFVLATFSLYSVLSIASLEPIERLKLLIFNYGGTGIFMDWNFLSIFRMLRNDFLILYHGYGLVSILGGVLGIIFLLKRKKIQFVIFILSFVIPFILSGKFWYGGLFGRYSILIAYPLSVLLAVLPYRKIYWIIIIILSFSFSQTLYIYQKKPISEIQRNIINEINLSDGDLLILSDYQRPQLFYSNGVYINGNKKNQEILENNIEKEIFENKKVFISQQAIDFPYWQYDGQQIHIISKGDREKAQLKKFLENKKLILINEDINYPLLNIYQIYK